MDARWFVDPNFPAQVAAPFWFVQFFKVLGFALHAVPMGLWFAGLPLAMLLAAFGPEHGRRFSARLMRQMPVIIAFGVNLGIVPLLFVQVTYAKAFYPATILMAWYWLAVVAMLIPAYYGVYAYAFGLAASGSGGQQVRGSADRQVDQPSRLASERPDSELASDRPTAAWRIAAGWIAAVLFMAVGFVFSNAMSLMVNLEAWPGLWSRTETAGAVSGTALNVADPSVLPRWLLVLGLGMMTTGAWVALDAAWFARRESEAYRLWAQRFAFLIYTAGAVWFAVVGSWYVFGTWGREVQAVMWHSPAAVLTVLTGVAPAAAASLLLVFGWWARECMSRQVAVLVAAAQFGTLALNAIGRQVVQNVELGRFIDVGAQPTAVQWGPAAMFLITFVFGLAVVGWMLLQVARAPAQKAG